MFLFFYDTLVKQESSKLTSGDEVAMDLFVAVLNLRVLRGHATSFFGLFFNQKSTSKGIICSLFQTGPFTVVIDSYRQSYVRD